MIVSFNYELTDNAYTSTQETDHIPTVGSMGSTRRGPRLSDAVADHPFAGHPAGWVARRPGRIVAAGHAPDGLARAQADSLDVGSHDGDQYDHGHIDRFRPRVI